MSGKGLRFTSLAEMPERYRKQAEQILAKEPVKPSPELMKALNSLLPNAESQNKALQGKPANQSATKTPEPMPASSVASQNEYFKVLGREPPNRMNEWEAQYAEYLDLRRHIGEIRDFGFERMKFRLANRTFYTPDFDVVMSDLGLEFHEIKGFKRDDAIAKFKIARDFFPYFKFRMFTKDNGNWREIYKE